MKLLNLDQLDPKTDRKVRIDGVDYSIIPISVASFIATTKEAKALIEGGKFDALREVEMIVDLLSQCLPDVARHQLEALPLDKLKAIADFVRGDDVDGAEDVEGNG